ncbi:hexose transporter protein [Aspergillus ellipticus CBS 707.79]|uniref:Hexose transporter protein n=1 Tax=Aspergillus ellipticus CBS 707.79 TaxID=1448320 RepID=A0A319DLC8_9EURO|nr:hexose transporter protein [Aspergillus ellipticus CBS 707.79]
MTATTSFANIANNTDPCWWKDPCLRWNVLYAFRCMLCPFYLGYDQSLLTGLQAMPFWTTYFDNPKGDWLGIISAAILMPGIVMGFPAAWICNTWGRKVCIYCGCVFIIAGAIWNALATNAIQFLISRVVMGLGGGLTKTSAPALLQEIAHPRLRSPSSTMYYGCYCVGSLLSAIMCIVGLGVENDWSWRFPCLLALVGPVFVLPILSTGPESPRFLVRIGKNSKALETLADSHANGDVNDSLVQWEYREIQTALEEEAHNNKTSYLDFFKTRGNRRRLFVSIMMAIGVNWVGNGVVSYYLSSVLKAAGVTESHKILAVNAGIAAWNLVVSEIAGLYVDDLGRRPIFLTSTVGMIFSYAFLGIAVVPFLFLFYGFYDLARTTLNYSYCAEIMPFSLRTKGLAIFLCAQQLASTFNQFVNPIAMEAISWRYYGVYIAIDCLFVVLIYFYFPETKKMSIEEVAMIFDYDMKGGRAQAATALQGIDKCGVEVVAPADGKDLHTGLSEHVERNDEQDCRDDE